MEISYALTETHKDRCFSSLCAKHTLIPGGVFSQICSSLSSIPSAYLSWTCVHLHFQYIIKKEENAWDTHLLPLALTPLSHKRTHCEGTLLSAQCVFSLHIQYIISPSHKKKTRHPVPYFIKWSQGSFYLRAHESVLTKTWHSSQVHPRSLSQ